MRRAGLLAAALTGAVAGAALVLSIPAPGVPVGPVSEPPLVPEGAVVGEAPIRTLLAWTPGGLPEGFAENVRRQPPVRRVTEVRSGVVWLDSWADLGPGQTPPPGLRVPMEVAAVDPRSYAAFVPPAERAEVEALGGRRAILGETGARLRDVGPGGTLRFGTVTLRVGAILPDELVGGHEVVVGPETGARLGVTSPRYLLVEPEDGAGLRRVESGIRRAVPPGTRIRIRAPGETPVFRHGDAVLAPVRLKELFGEFAAAPVSGGFIRQSPAWVRENIRTVRLPVLGEFRCHRLVIPLVRGVMEELARRGLTHEINSFAGCYSPRFANRDPGAGLSHHSWGIALDINVPENPLGAEPNMDRRVVEVFERWGFTWGGRWLVPDGMHFEFLRFPQSD